jgi:CO/xanthine dehydrogenase FAD-binding subunit
MNVPLNHVIIPSSFQELFSSWSHFPDAVPYAGGTSLIRRQGVNLPALPPIYLCLDNIEDMHRITRTEQYLEIGAMVKLNRLLHLGKMVPEVIRNCLENIAGVQVRNLATIGGNICSNSEGDSPDLPAPLTALDAQYELRNAFGSRWISSSRFHSKEDALLENQELLTRIRLPLYQWDYSIYKKFGGDALVFLAKAQKNVLSDIRVVYKAQSTYRNKDGESILNGKSLPISRKTADEFVENWKGFLFDKKEPEFSKNTLLNSIEENIYNLSE